MTDFTPIRLACTHSADLHFDGKLIGEYSTQNKAGSKTRWTELRLWETPAGNWIAESVGCSTRDGEGELREARVIQQPAQRSQGWGPGQAPPHEEAMDAWGWSTAAKALARQLGWDVIRRVD